MILRKISHVAYIRIRHTHRNKRKSEAGWGGPWWRLPHQCLGTSPAQKQLYRLYRASSTTQLKQKNLPRANSSGTAGNRTNLQTIRVPFFHRLFTCARTYGCAVLMALLALLGVDGCCLLNYTTSVTYAFPMAISFSVIHFVIIYICRHKCDHG